MRRAGALAMIVLGLGLHTGGVVIAADGTIEAEAGEEGSESGGDGGGSDVFAVSCDYSNLVVLGSGRSKEDDYELVYIDASLYRFRESTGEAWVRAYEVCDMSDGSVRTRNVWQLISEPDPAILIPDLYDQVIKTVDPPDPSLSPVGPGYVHLGMWLATAEPPENPVVAYAAAGSAWAEVTATLVSTTFDMGNGDVVVCDGVGTPIPDSAKDSLDEGPCGYTYTEPSNGTLTVTVTATWAVTFELSDGDTGTRPDIVLSTPVDYEVFEIQTVGRGN